MKHQNILNLASSLYTTAFNHARYKITKKQADVQVYDAINKFIDILKKNPGYEGRGNRIITPNG